MSFFTLAAILMVITALFTLINDRLVRMPTTIGVMLIAMGVSLLLVLARGLAGGVNEQIRQQIHNIDFSTLLMQGMLAFLLFAGAMEVNVPEMRRQWVAITVLAVGTTLLSTAAIGFGVYGGMAYLGWHVPLLPCLIFGALISPTDPVAVVGILKSVNAPASLEAQLAGESLFNDGIGIVLFQVLLEVHAGHTSPDALGVGKMFLLEAGGGMLLGLACGAVTYFLLKCTEHDQTELLLTIALAMGVYSLGAWLGVSGPIAVVVAGLLIGEKGRAHAMNPISREHVDTFWEMVDSVLNSLLFLLIGVGVLMLPFDAHYLIAGLLAIVVSLLARFLSVASVIKLLSLKRSFVPGTIAVLTWGGLRGGIAVAMALSLPHDLPQRDLLLTAAYGVVVFSILVQGLSIGNVIDQRCTKKLSGLLA